MQCTFQTQITHTVTSFRIAKHRIRILDLDTGARV